MKLDGDTVLIGSGTAPLIAASQLIKQGKSVLLLNPEHDFFLTDSELALEPFFLSHVEQWKAEWFSASDLDGAMSNLQADYPGALEKWSYFHSQLKFDSFYNFDAPHVRARERLWVRSPFRPETWPAFDDLFFKLSQLGQRPKLLEGPAVSSRLPGFGKGNVDRLQAIQVPALVDVDLARYRIGLLSYIRERLGADRVFTDVTAFELNLGLIQFFSNEKRHTARFTERCYLFPSVELVAPITRAFGKAALEGIQFQPMEEWTLVSKSPIEPKAIANFENAVIWSDIEGYPGRSEAEWGKLKILIEPANSLGDVVGKESFQQIEHIVQDLLGWSRYSVRSIQMKNQVKWPLSHQSARQFEQFTILPATTGFLGRISQTLSQEMA